MGTTLTILPEGVRPVYVYVPDGYKERPKTVDEVLSRTKAALAEEGRWIKHQSTKNLGHTADGGFNEEDPFCGSWSACLTGMVCMVTSGVVRDRLGRDYVGCGLAEHQDYSQLADAAIQLLDAAARLKAEGGGLKGEIQSCVGYNDHHNISRSDVLSLIGDTQRMVAKVSGALRVATEASARL